MVENKTVLKAADAEAEASLLKVNSLLLPLVDTLLLVPQLAVAEVLSSDDFSVADLRADSSHPHCYGWISWRDQDIPVLSFDSIYSGHRPQLGKNLKIVICNAVFKAEETGFYALLVSNFPRALRLSMEAEMVLDGSPSDQPGVQMAVTIDDEAAFIPDFELIEKIVCDIVEKRLKQP